MSETPTDQQLAEWERLAEAATDGVWHLWDRPSGPEHGYELRAGWRDEDLHLGFLGEDRATAEFIVAARDAVPSLLRALREARDENRRLRDLLGAAGRCGVACPTLLPGVPPTRCDLRAGHVGWHQSNSGAEWSLSEEYIEWLRARRPAAVPTGQPDHECDTGVFDRSICPEPCGTMHSYCATCGTRQDPCPNEGPQR